MNFLWPCCNNGFFCYETCTNWFFGWPFSCHWHLCHLLCHLLMCFSRLYCKHYGPRSDCSLRSRLIRAHSVCFLDKNSFQRNLILVEIINRQYFEDKKYWQNKQLTLKAPITTAADDKFCNIFPNFRKKYSMTSHENRLPADDSHEISCFICYFWKSIKIWKCRLLQIIGGVLWVKYIFCVGWKADQSEIFCLY